MTFRPSDRTQRFAANEGWLNRGANDWAAFGVMPEATGTLALTAGTAVVTPFFLPLHATFSNIGHVITTAATAGLLNRVGIYRWNPVTRTLGDLLFDAGTILADATGIRSQAASGLTLQSGWYAVVIVSSGAPTVRTILGAQGEQSESFTVNATNLEATTHYTAAAGFAAGTAFPASGAAITLTRVVSTSEFRPNHIGIGQYVPSRIAV